MQIWTKTQNIANFKQKLKIIIIMEAWQCAFVSIAKKS